MQNKYKPASKTALAALLSTETRVGLSTCLKFLAGTRVREANAKAIVDCADALGLELPESAYRQV